MAEKVLNLKLKYKDKKLDVIKADLDFKNNVVIGNSKYIFWQILDKTFPQKHTLLSKSGSSYKLHLREGMDYVVRKNNRELNKDELKKANILSGNKLILKPDTEGMISFAKDWKIEFNFAIPYKFEPTKEEISLARKFAHLPPLSPQQRFTRIFVILGLLFTTIGLYLAELNYEPPQSQNLVDRVEKFEEIATQVQPEVQEVQQERGTQKKDEEEVADEVEQAQEMSSAEFEAEFGLSLDSGMPGGEGSADFSNELLEVTSVQEIAAVGTGGPGAGTSRPNRATADLDLAGTGGFDLESAGDGLGDLSGIAGLDLGIDGGFEEVDMSSLSGNVGEYKIHKIKGAADFKAVKKRFAGIKKIKEGSINVKDVTPEFKTELANIDQVVSTYKPRINKLYAVESMIMDMHGSIEFTLYIMKDGTIDAVEIEVAKGSYFTNSFLDKAHEIVKDWKISVKNPAIYSFRMKFLQ